MLLELDRGLVSGNIYISIYTTCVGNHPPIQNVTMHYRARLINTSIVIHLALD